MNEAREQSESKATSSDASLLEVEQKYRVTSHVSILDCLKELDGCEKQFEEQCDIYLKHPCRDFAVTGEAFRIRLVNDSAVVTYKGERLAGPIKTRSEIEIPLAAKTNLEWLQVLLGLGFSEVARIRKQRRSFSITFQSDTFTIALDDVESLGKFVEIEAIVTDRSTLARIQTNILELAMQMRLEQAEPRSYLRQHLEQLGSDSQFFR